MFFLGGGRGPQSGEKSNNPPNLTLVPFFGPELHPPTVKSVRKNLILTQFYINSDNILA